MKLSYRGHSYETRNNAVASNVEVQGQYRGVKAALHSARLPVQHDNQLTYRGVRYTGG
ncbi:MAG: DUF4278 domain-containing protein [Spirulinaceae cyanobacterium RM2_2_10]|nr:DUF4278 domain-containing protein [Spirulinaceae cyanobacterium SM2_1_0]NJO21295.1 DUF4278 domain-containing protein [Spirulinaceae cyanobacterium RM2_2_10]